MPVTRIVIQKGGRITIEGIGYVGKQCLKDLQRILEALKQYGIELNVEDQQLKEEAHVHVEVAEVEEMES